MTTRCEQCGHLNSSAAHRCEVCNRVLPAPWSPPSQDLDQTAQADPDRIEIRSEPKVRTRYPDYHPPRLRSRPSANTEPYTFEGPGQEGTQGHLRMPPTSETARTRRPPFPRERLTPPGNVLQGNVVRVDELAPERPAINLPRMLSSLILTADLVLLLGPLILVVIGLLVALVVVSALLGAQWMLTLFGFLMQSVFYFLSPIIGGLLQRRRDPRLEPVTNYVVRTNSGETRTFRVKGQLQGATVAKGDRVLVEGRTRHGILMFRRGHKLDTGEQLSLPFNWSWLLLAAAVVANIAGYVALQGQP